MYAWRAWRNRRKLIARGNRVAANILRAAVVAGSSANWHHLAEAEARNLGG